MIVEQTKNKISIWAQIVSSCSPATDEWSSECRIYQRKQLIGSLDDTMPDQMCIRGTFDYMEDGKDKEGIPNIFDNALYLSIEDLIVLKEIIEHWIDDELHEENWEEE